MAVGILNERETHPVREDERRSVSLIAIADEVRILRLNRSQALQVVFKDHLRLLRYSLVSSLPLFQKKNPNSVVHLLPEKY